MYSIGIYLTEFISRMIFQLFLRSDFISKKTPLRLKYLIRDSNGYLVPIYRELNSNRICFMDSNLTRGSYDFTTEIQIKKGFSSCVYHLFYLQPWHHFLGMECKPRRIYTCLSRKQLTNGTSILRFSPHQEICR